MLTHSLVDGELVKPRNKGSGYFVRNPGGPTQPEKPKYPPPDSKEEEEEDPFPPADLNRLGK